MENWTDSYLLGIREIDEQHRGFFELWENECRSADLNNYDQLKNIIDKLEESFSAEEPVRERLEKLKDTFDIDFIVDFSGVDLFDYADNYFDLKSSLENLLNRDIDLLEEQAISNPYLRQSIDSSKQLVYG